MWVLSPKWTTNMSPAHQGSESIFKEMDEECKNQDIELSVLKCCVLVMIQLLHPWTLGRFWLFCKRCAQDHDEKVLMWRKRMLLQPQFILRNFPQLISFWKKDHHSSLAIQPRQRWVMLQWSSPCSCIYEQH